MPELPVHTHLSNVYYWGFGWGGSLRLLLSLLLTGFVDIVAQTGLAEDVI
jgi:hypothetical protein